jgi:hypothetical protein
VQEEEIRWVYLRKAIKCEAASPCVKVSCHMHMILAHGVNRAQA